MNTSFRTAPRFTAFAFAAVMTVAMLMGVGGLADHGNTSVHLAQASASQAKSV